MGCEPPLENEIFPSPSDTGQACTRHKSSAWRIPNRSSTLADLRLEEAKSNRTVSARIGDLDKPPAANEEGGGMRKDVVAYVHRMVRAQEIRESRKNGKAKTFQACLAAFQSTEAKPQTLGSCPALPRARSSPAAPVGGKGTRDSALLLVPTSSLPSIKTQPKSADGKMRRHSNSELLERQKRHLFRLKLKMHKQKRSEEERWQRKLKLQQQARSVVLQRRKVRQEELLALGAPAIVDEKEVSADQSELAKGGVFVEPPKDVDWIQFRRRNHLLDNTKVFIMNGPYPELTKALKRRGWFQNLSSDSRLFHLKWSLKSDDTLHTTLLPYQLVNHFQKNVAITTKVGLCRSLRRLTAFQEADVDSFFPRCFNLNDEMEEFIDYFKKNQAISHLRRCVSAFESDDCLPGSAMQCRCSLQVCARIVQDEDHWLDGEGLSEAQTCVQEEEWDIISNPQPSEGKARAIMRSDISYPEVVALLERLKGLDPQFDMQGCDNIWIVKPAGKSRGRGISCLNHLDGILHYVQGCERQWVAQKYIERPLLIHRKKFDIRQWVLVTDWNPLTIWFYEDCYLRFASHDYTPDPVALNNRYVHLCNNSIQKDSDQYDQMGMDGLMWTRDRFADHLIETTGSHAHYWEKILPSMKNIVVQSLMCAQDTVINRKNSCEVYGYDFMVDEDYSTWLLEINSSPAMEYSTGVTESLCSQVLEDVAKVIVDCDCGRSIAGMSEGGDILARQDSFASDLAKGKWEMLYKSKWVVGRATGAASLVCKGTSLKRKVSKKSRNKSHL